MSYEHGGEGASVGPRWLMAVVMVVGLAWASGAAAQRIMSEPGQVITLAKGGSALLTQPQPLKRVLVGDPSIADYALVSPGELVVNALAVGSTSLFVWEQDGGVRMYTIAVSPDVGALQRQMDQLFPQADIRITASGQAVVVSGTVRDPRIARRAMEILQSGGAEVINNLVAPSAQQVLLHVRFAEVDRSILHNLSSDLRALNPHEFGNVEKVVGSSLQTLSEGIVQLLLLGDNGTELDWFLRALRTQGYFKSLAEPNLVAIEGQEATFLAGGEFPYPSVQGGQNSQVSIQWKEFGIRLNFTPRIMNDGGIRLEVAPEVSSLDFANGLTFSGYQIPALNTRRAETQVELKPGQSIAIAGPAEQRAPEGRGPDPDPGADPDHRRLLQQPLQPRHADRAAGDRHAVHRSAQRRVSRPPHGRAVHVGAQQDIQRDGAPSPDRRAGGPARFHSGGRRAGRVGEP